MKYVLIISDGEIVNEMSSNELWRLVNFIEEKNMDIKQIHISKDILLSGSNRNLEFFLIFEGDKDKGELFNECKSIYHFLPTLVRKKFKLVELKYGEKAILDEDDRLFSLNSVGDKIKDFKVLDKDLDYETAFKLNMDILKSFMNRSIYGGYVIKDNIVKFIPVEVNMKTDTEYDAISIYNDIANALNKYKQKDYVVFIPKTLKRLSNKEEFILKNKGVEYVKNLK
jgi:hypothetical protein